MTGPPRSRRRLVQLLAVAGAALLTMPGCEAEPGADPAAREPIALRLSERLTAADVQPSAEHVVFLGEAGQALLRAGWHEAQPRDGGGRRWSRNRASSLDVPVVEPADLTLALELTSVRQLLRKPADAEVQRLQILWNGELMADEALAVEGERLELLIPADRQRIGLNQLDLLPSYWVTPRVYRLSWDNRVLGLRLDGLSARSAAPQATSAGPLARSEGVAIVQSAGSVVSFGLRLPDEARLTGRLRLRGNAPRAGRARVSLTDESGSQSLLVDRSLDELVGEAGLAIDADLASRAGRFVALDLAFALASEEAPVPAPELSWEALRIEGTKPAAPAATRIPRHPYNVIVLLPDSLRADHVRLAPSDASSNARRLAERGVSFDAMRSNSSWTRPAVASMLTSLGPVSHGIHSLEDNLDPSLTYLPQLLKQAGYRTFAILNSPVVSPAFRFGRGYDSVTTYYEMREQRRAAPDFGPATEVDHLWQEYVAPQLKKAGERPFFLFIHEIDPHSPYEPPQPYAEQHATGLRAYFNLSGTAGPDPNFFHYDPSYFDPGEMAYLHGLYRGEVAYMDDYLGRLLDVLDASGLTEETLVVLISDHGEEFFEHRGIGHGKTVFEEQLRVPFIMSLPGVLPEGARVTVAAQTIDVAPTLLDLVGAEIPPAMQGRSLLPWIEGAAPETLDRPIVAHAMNRREESIQRGRWKLVRSNPQHPNRGGPSYALFDLESDPSEITDLWPRQPIVGLALRQELELAIARQAAATGRRADPAPEPIPPELIEALKALGYGRE